MRLVEVQERKETCVGRLSPDPALEESFGFVSTALDLPDRLRHVPRFHAVFVEVEAFRDAGPVVENDRRDRGAGRVAGPLQQGRERRVFPRKPVSPKNSLPVRWYPAAIRSAPYKPVPPSGSAILR